MRRRLTVKQRRVCKKIDNPLLDISAPSLAVVVQSVLLDQSKTREEKFLFP